MAFTAESFKLKLSKLNETTQSIQTLSHWVQYHKKSCVESAAVWAAETRALPPSRQLLYVYLANDVMQNSRRKGPEFVNAYGAQCLAILPGVFASQSEAVQAKLRRLLAIWEERHVLPPILTELRKNFRATVAPTPPPSSVSKPGCSPAAAAAAAVCSDDEEEYVPGPMGGGAAGGAFGGATAGGASAAALPPARSS